MIEMIVFVGLLFVILGMAAGAVIGSAIEQVRWHNRIAEEREAEHRISFSEGFNAGVMAERDKKPVSYISTLAYAPTVEDLQSE